MAKTKQTPVEREYIINLRREIMKAPKYKRTPKAVKAVKQFIAKHMRIPERDVKKVKIDKWLNQELWFRGIQNPPTKIKVKAKKQGENVIVSLAEIPEILKFKIAREEKSSKEAEKIKKDKKEKAEAEKKQEAKKTVESEKKDAEEKKDEEKDKKQEVEKAEAIKEAGEKTFEAQAKQMKHIKPIKAPIIQRKALQK